VTEEFHLPAAVAGEMIAHCEAGRPNEACGLLSSEQGRIVACHPMTNAAQSPVRYALDPKEQLAVYRSLEEAGRELAGVFHSHTRTDALPSPTDVRLASEDVPYLIISLAVQPPDIRAWRIVKQHWTDSVGAIEEIPVVLDG
jgi:[CysO sulfur-carrier protein]-S-L-cysteine hydrolase